MSENELSSKEALIVRRNAARKERIALLQRLRAVSKTTLNQAMHFTRLQSVSTAQT